MKIKFISMILILLSIFSGCGSMIQNDVVFLDNLNIIDTYLFNEFIINENLSNPTDILFADNYLFISDTRNNRILKINLIGEIEKQIGSAGYGKNEFISPKSMQYINNNIYIHDKDNNRICIYDLDLNYIDALDLPVYDNVVEEIMDFIVNDRNEIYFSLRTPDKNYLNFIDSTNKIQIIKSDSFGNFKQFNDKIYYITGHELKKDGSTVHFSSGESYLQIFFNNVQENIYSLPYKYTPSDIIITDEYIYMFSVTFNTLDKFDKQCNYIETIAHIEFKTIDYCTSMAYDGENFYLLDQSTARIFKISE